MTREEAAQELIQHRTRLWRAMGAIEAADKQNSYLTGMKNESQALDLAIAALREPVLDENGLARCGCGGKTYEYYVHHPYENKGHRVECIKCGIAIGGCDTTKTVHDAWNRAMGRASE